MKRFTMGCEIRLLLALFAPLIVLTGCEAPLVLDGVERVQQQPLRRTDRYQAAARIAHDVVVVGNQGVLLHSPDLGASWQRHELAGWPALIDIAACPDGRFVALAFEQKIYVSTDGDNWDERPLPTAETPQAVTCAPNDTIWVVGSFTSIWGSTDNGQNWTATELGEDTILTTVQFIDAQRGVITGEYGTHLRTEDGGATWESMPSLPNEFYPQDAYFADVDEGWVVGLGGTVLHTTDAGQQWRSESTDTLVSLYGLERLGDRYYLVGGEGTMLVHRQDGSWRKVEHGAPVRLYLRDVLALDERRLLIVGVAGALHVVTPGA